jgi:hypothetical protein
MTFTPNFDAFEARVERVRDEVLPLSYGPMNSPLSTWLVALAGYERGVFGLYDHPADVREVFEIVHWKAVEGFTLMAESPCPVLWVGDGTNADFESPALYAEHAVPTIRAIARAAHSVGKPFLAHMCGKLNALLPLIREAELDVVDSFTPPPMGDAVPRKAWDMWGGNVTLYGGIPAEWAWNPSVSEKEIVAGMARLYSDLRPGDRFMAALPCYIPGNAMPERLRLIAELNLRYGEEACQRIWG